MSTTRRPLGHGPQHQDPAVPQIDTSATQRLHATEADVQTTPLYRTGRLQDLARLRERGVLGSPDPVP
ncbi:hypothetical protein ACIRO1_45230 [Streptomyces sp. NPDC102381]|uniref:hypothetical protein n=1 Tax=Streptomyces sp. NPDC102381 TaxID=3366164 RepID=UPI00381F2EB9